MKQKRILIVRTDRVGDTIMLTPIAREIKRSFPDSFVATLTQPHTAELLLHNPNIDKRITDDLNKETFWQTVKTIRSYKFTHGLLLLPRKRAAYQMFLAGIPHRIGVGHKLYEVITFMSSVSRNNYIPLRHEADYCMDLARALGVEAKSLQRELFVTEEEKENTRKKILALGGIEGIKKVVIHTGSAGSSPQWSEDKYYRFISQLLEEYQHNIQIILTAKETSDEFRAKVKILGSAYLLDLTQSYNSLGELVALLSIVDLFISSSTGPSHIADGLNIPAIAMYCHRPMNCATLWGLSSPNSTNVEVSAEYCDGHCSADKETCRFHDGISIDEVMAIVREKLK